MTGFALRFDIVASRPRGAGTQASSQPWGLGTMVNQGPNQEQLCSQLLERKHGANNAHDSHNPTPNAARNPSQEIPNELAGR